MDLIIGPAHRPWGNNTIGCLYNNSSLWWGTPMIITPRIHRPTADQVQRCTLHNKNAVIIFKSKCLNPLIRKTHTIPWLSKAWHSSNDSTVRPFGIWYFNIILYSPSWKQIFMKSIKPYNLHNNEWPHIPSESCDRKSKAGGCWWYHLYPFLQSTHNDLGPPKREQLLFLSHWKGL